MKTEKKRFKNFLKQQGFILSEVLQRCELVPHFYKDKSGNSYLLSSCNVCMFDGVNTPPGGLGCVTFYYGGLERSKYQRQSQETEALKKVFCPTSYKQAKEEFLRWSINARDIIRTWTKII